jgi:DNA (cytosine-5)-methyltransferase 1
MDRCEASRTEGSGNDASTYRRRIDPGYIQAATLSIGGQNWNAPASESDVARVADGIPDRVDRNHALGNAVVPQISELIGRAIMEIAA